MTRCQISASGDRKGFKALEIRHKRKKNISARTPRSKQDRKPCTSILSPFSEPCFVYGSMEDGGGTAEWDGGERKVVALVEGGEGPA